MSFLRLFGKLSLDGSGFEKTLAKADNQAKTFSNSLERQFTNLATRFAGIFAGTAAINGMQKLAKEADRLQNLLDEFGIDPVFAQQLGFAFETGPSGRQGAASALRRSIEQLTSAKAGSRESTTALNALGLSPLLQQDLSPEDVVQAAVRVIRQTGGNLSQTQREAISKLLGSESIPGLKAFTGGGFAANTRSEIARLDAADDRATRFLQNLEVSAIRGLGGRNNLDPFKALVDAPNSSVLGRVREAAMVFADEFAKAISKSNDRP